MEGSTHQQYSFHPSVAFRSIALGTVPSVLDSVVFHSSPPLTKDAAKIASGSCLLPGTVNPTEVYTEPVEQLLEAFVPDTWKFPKITRPGMYFRPETTHRCTDMKQLDHILSQSIVTFKDLSLKVNYHDSPIRAYCHTMEQVEFTFNVWEHRNNNKELIVELQRTSGDSDIFYRYARDIFSALLDQANPERHIPIAPRFTPHQERNLMRLFQHQPSESIRDALGLVVSLLSSQMLSEKLIALQTLATLVNPTLVLPSSAKEVAKTILLGHGFTTKTDGTNMEHSVIQKQILCLVIFRKWFDVPIENTKSCLEDKSHYLALEIMASAVQFLENSAEMALLTNAANGELLIQSLGERIKNAATEPHEACLAARVLCCIYRLQPEVVRTRLGIQEVRVAETIGRKSHAALEAESQKLRSALEVA